MKNVDIESCFNEIRSQVINGYSDSLNETFKEKYEKYANSDGDMDYSSLFAFCYIESLIESIKINSEITLKVLVELLGDE